MQRIHRSGRLIYYDVPKAASTSIKTALEIKAIGYAYGEVPPPPDELEGFKFSFVRHPITRLLSAYNMYFHNPIYQHPGLQHPQLPTNLADFIECALYDDDNVHWVPQHRFLPIVDNEIKLDFLGKFETLAKDWAYLMEKFDLPELPIINQSRCVAKTLPPVYVNLVIKRYARDFELLGYDPNSWE